MSGVESIGEPAGLLLRDAAYSTATSAIVYINIRFFRRQILSAPTADTIVLKSSGLTSAEKLDHALSLSLIRPRASKVLSSVSTKTGLLSTLG
jgi:hypothetical protein